MNKKRKEEIKKIKTHKAIYKQFIFIQVPTSVNW
jgi:hypothetical protein